MVQSAWYETNAILEIQRRANLGVERVLRGFKSDSDSAPRGLLDAKTFTIDSPQAVRFTSGIDSKERRFYLQDNKLMYDPDTSVGLDETAVLDNISSLTFTASLENPTRVILIELIVSKEVKGVNKTISLSGTAFLRNE